MYLTFMIILKVNQRLTSAEICYILFWLLAHCSRINSTLNNIWSFFSPLFLHFLPTWGFLYWCPCKCFSVSILICVVKPLLVPRAAKCVWMQLKVQYLKPQLLSYFYWGVALTLGHESFYFFIMNKCLISQTERLMPLFLCSHIKL